MTNILSDMDKRIIEKRADAVLNAISYYDDFNPRVDSVQLARFFGFTVEERDLSQHEDGNINVFIPKEGDDRKEERSIVVNRNRSFEQKRFIITHELSHYLLHYTGEMMFKHREDKKGKNSEENDADYMAACLLMPGKRFGEQYYALKDVCTHEQLVQTLQIKFATPKESIIRRIEEVCL